MPPQQSVKKSPFFLFTPPDKPRVNHKKDGKGKKRNIKRGQQNLPSSSKKNKGEEKKKIPFESDDVKMTKNRSVISSSSSSTELLLL